MEGLFITIIVVILIVRFLAKLGVKMGPTDTPYRGGPPQRRRSKPRPQTPRPTPTPQRPAPPIDLPPPVPPRRPPSPREVIEIEPPEVEPPTPSLADPRTEPPSPPRLEPVPPPAPAVTPTPRPKPKGEPVDVKTVTRVLFGEDASSFDAERIFIQQFEGRPIRWKGELRSVDRFHRDMVLGEGPAVRATVLVHRMASRYGVKEIVAVVRFPDEEADRLREHRGDRITFRGRLLKCDPFLRKIYVEVD
jgi:hypothetical protein